VAQNFVIKKLQFCRGSPQWRFRGSSLHRFDTVQQCDRRTDGRTDRQTDRQTPRP